jgi:hypothetical protein
MSIAADGTWSPVRAPAFARTVELALIHRRNAEEAFLTDVVRTGPHGFVAGAVLPDTHPHYAAHTGPSALRDPMLLLECARQAMTYASHELYGVEPEARFVLRGLTADFARARAPRPGPAELVLRCATGRPKVVRDRVRGLDFDLELDVAGDRAGRVRMEIGYLSPEAYAVVRSRAHGGSPPPSSDDLPPAAGLPVPPAEAGRVHATDTLLLDVAPAGPEALGAVLRVPTGNRSLLDHAQDHVPGMVLVEAARQLAVLATGRWGGPPPERTRMASVTASFATYAELDAPVGMTAVPAGPSVEVGFTQAGADVARVRVGTATGWAR